MGYIMGYIGPIWGTMLGTGLPCKIFPLPKESPFSSSWGPLECLEIWFQAPEIWDTWHPSGVPMGGWGRQISLEGSFCWKCTGKNNSEDVYGTCWVGGFCEFFLFHHVFSDISSPNLINPESCTLIKLNQLESKLNQIIYTYKHV